MTGRDELARLLSADPRFPTKTYVLEAHPGDDPVNYLSELAGPGNLEPTDDAYLFRLLVPTVPDGSFWVDQLDERFWNFHTNMRHKDAFPYLRDHVTTRRDLDWMWLPSDHLGKIWPGASARQVRSRFEAREILGDTAAVEDVKLQLSGRNADVLLDRIYSIRELRSAVSFDSVSISLDEPDLGIVSEAVHRMGRFAASGNSPEFHFHFVQKVIDRYKRLVTLCEQKALEWHSFDRLVTESGGTVSGTPIAIRFSRRIPDLERFADELFSSRDPYRLWGIPRIDRNAVEVEAVDLHVGETLAMDITPEWMRVYLTAGSCGNTIARLVTNLQHSFDAALSFVDLELQKALQTAPPKPESTI